MPSSTLYPYTVVGTASDGSEIRKFADQRIASSIDAAIADANLKPDQTTAVIVSYKEQAGSSVIRGAIMRRVYVTVPSWVPLIKSKRAEWSFAGVIAHDLTNSDTVKEAGMVIRL